MRTVELDGLVLEICPGAAVQFVVSPMGWWQMCPSKDVVVQIVDDHLGYRRWEVPRGWLLEIAPHRAMVQLMEGDGVWPTALYWREET